MNSTGEHFATKNLQIKILQGHSYFVLNKHLRTTRHTNMVRINAAFLIAFMTAATSLLQNQFSSLSNIPPKTPN
jgi:hypothetical protein